MSHTPGPWEVRAYEAHWRILSETQSVVVAETVTDETYDGPADAAEERANAYLIATAPTMLEALSRLRKQSDHDWSCSATHGKDAPCNCGFRETCILADAAIAAANGK